MKRIAFLTYAVISICLSLPGQICASEKVSVPGGPSLGDTPVALPPAPAPMPVLVVAPTVAAKSSVVPPDYSASVTVLIPAAAPVSVSSSAFVAVPSYKDALAKGGTPPALAPAPTYYKGDTPLASVPSKSEIAKKDVKLDAKEDAALSAEAPKKMVMMPVAVVSASKEKGAVTLGSSIADIDMVLKIHSLNSNKFCNGPIDLVECGLYKSYDPKIFFFKYWYNFSRFQPCDFLGVDQNPSKKELETAYTQLFTLWDGRRKSDKRNIKQVHVCRHMLDFINNAWSNVWFRQWPRTPLPFQYLISR